ncbi:Panacea domain-containing protein [Streptomyces longwoodensis]|uniref:Panacea domain-containing protein n=1 Tax=Streptomyces longwoodensis TaxID=68231 RepID=UPI00340975F4
MGTVHDVATYILQKQGSMSAMKLQKLCYYSQAWNLVWEEAPLFPERIEAWANGPVIRDLYNEHRGQFTVSTEDLSKGDPERLTPRERGNIDIVLDFYGGRPAHELSELTHRESPWRDARGQLPPGANSTAEITPTAMHEYYDGLVGTGD